MNVVLCKSKEADKLKTLVLFASFSGSDKDKKIKCDTSCAPLKKLVSDLSAEKTFGADTSECLIVRNCAEADGKNVVFVGLGDSKNITKNES